MMNKKGQALVEFVLILPVFLMILFVIVDFGVIFNSKNSLENISSDIVLMYENGDSVSDIESEYEDIYITVSDYKDKYVKITVKKYVNIITPGLDRILDDPYEIKIERVISDA